MAKDNALSNKSLHAFPAPDAILAVIGESFGYREGKVGDVLYQGENRPCGALLTYYINQVDGDHANIDIVIKDAMGKVVRHLKDEVDAPGVHRVQWDLSRDRPRLPNKEKPEEESWPGGIKVSPGAYFVEFTHEGQKAQTTVVVIPDPRLQRTVQDFQTKDELIVNYYAIVEEATKAADELREMEQKIDWLKSRAKMQDVELDSLLIHKFSDKLQEHKERLLGKEVQGIYRQPDVVTNILRETGYALDILEPATINQKNQLKVAERSTDRFLESWAAFKSRWVPQLLEEINSKGITVF
jgi:hypothetical protein